MVQIGLPCSPEWLCELIAYGFGLLGSSIIIYIAFLAYRGWQEDRKD